MRRKQVIESYWEVVEPLFSTIDYGQGPEEYVASIASIPRSSVLLFSAHMCLAEVHNGGFLQLFWNTTGVLVPEGIDGFNTIGMTTMAALLQRAASKLGAPYPRNRDDRWDALLIASGHGTKELKSIFDNQKNPYVAFAEATKRLGFDLLENEFWETAKTENGGFQKAATRYAQSPFLIQ